jgi:hypothetical protein
VISQQYGSGTLVEYFQVEQKGIEHHVAEPKIFIFYSTAIVL